MAAVPDKKLTDCYWFLQDQCKKGESCEYRHSQGAHDNPTTCKFWLQNQCTDKDCKFRHPSGVKAPCVFFAQGKCLRGDACPYLHAGPANPQLEEKKHKEEEELKKLQAQRKREEERLARLKAEREQLETKKQTNAPDRLTSGARNRKVAVGGTFGKTVTDIVKGVHDKSKPEKGKPGKIQQDKKTVATTGVKRNRESIQTKEPTGPVSFGVKSFDQIMQDKPKDDAVNDSESPKISQPKQNATDNLNELRRKNQQKFGTAQKKEQPATKAATAPSPKNPVVPTTSPKRQSEEPAPTEQKRQKVEPAPTPAPEPQSKDIEEEEDADLLALEELLA